MEIMVKILNYNISPDDSLSRDLTIYPKNVFNFIAIHGPYHFVALQGPTNWKALQKTTPILQKMVAVSYNSEREIVTLYDYDKYELDSTYHLLQGCIDNTGIIFLILFFRQNLCIINLYTKDVHNLDNHLEKIIINNEFREIYLKKISTYDIVLTGNLENISGSRLFARRLYGNYIFSTLQSYKNIMSDTSDHSAVISVLTKNIGYDFDGVLHMSVTEPDREGQRHPFHINGPFLLFDEIIDQIEKNIINDDKVLIITARPNTKFSYDVITRFLNTTKLKSRIDQIEILFSNSGSKVNLLNHYGINAFYDDSCLRINEIYYAKINDELPFLSQIYLVNPDDRSIILISHVNIGRSCSKYLPSYLNKMVQLLNTDSNKEIIINKCVNIIRQIIKTKKLQFQNPKIIKLLKKLEKGIRHCDLDKNECMQLQIDIITLINSETAFPHLASLDR